MSIYKHPAAAGPRSRSQQNAGNISVFISLVVRPGDTDIVQMSSQSLPGVTPSNQLIDAIVATCQIFSSCPRVKTNVLQGSTFNDKV